MTLKPFWRYYGGKWRAAPRYPKPRHDTIIEPFAGAAGYSLRYPDRRVVLLERYPIVAGIWRYLISVSAAEVRRIPPVDSVDDLPGWVLPFEPFGTFKEGLNKLGEGGSREVVALLDNAHPYDVGTLADTIFIQRCLT